VMYEGGAGVEWRRLETKRRVDMRS
jgi:hypothetical protein